MEGLLAGRRVGGSIVKIAVGICGFVMSYLLETRESGDRPVTMETARSRKIK